MLLALLVAQMLLVPSRPEFGYMSGVERPAALIQSLSPQASVLYSGHHDAAFVFAMRELDAERATRTYRTSVQVAEPEDVAEFLATTPVQFVAVEAASDLDSPVVYAQFREALEPLSELGFMELAAFDLSYDQAGIRHNIRLVVHARGDIIVPR